MNGRTINNSADMLNLLNEVGALVMKPVGAGKGKEYR